MDKSLLKNIIQVNNVSLLVTMMKITDLKDHNSCCMTEMHKKWWILFVKKPRIDKNLQITWIGKHHFFFIGIMIFAITFSNQTCQSDNPSIQIGSAWWKTIPQKGHFLVCICCFHVIHTSFNHHFFHWNQHDF